MIVMVMERMCSWSTGSEAPLLTDVSLRVPAKQMGLVYGRSGAGKTTLLQLIAGLTQPTSGRIAVVDHAGRRHFPFPYLSFVSMSLIFLVPVFQ